jgi:radical SAM superfamily enzyme YgiQ (UPF0313 family)
MVEISMTQKIIFSYINIQIPGFNSFQKSFEGTLINHGVALLITLLKQRGFDVQFYDWRKLTSWMDWDRICRTEVAKAWCFSYLSTDYLYAQRAITILKNYQPSALVIVGGAHASLSDMIMDEINADIIIRGEGDISLPEILASDPIASAGIVYGQSPDLSKLPLIDRDIFGVDEMYWPLFPELTPPVATMILGRGCPYHCMFCCERSKINGLPRMRPVEHVIYELKELLQKYSWSSIMFHDDLIAKREWLEEFIEAFGKSFKYMPFFAQIHPSVVQQHPDLIHQLSHIGLTWVSLGIESGSDRILRFIKKGTSRETIYDAVEILRKNKVKIFGNFILGFPTETPAESLMTVALIEEIKPDRLSPSIYTLFPGSQLYQYCVANDLILRDNWSEYSPMCRKIKGIDYAFLQGLLRRLTG